MPAYFNVIDLEPARTYATPEGAKKRVQEIADRFPGDAQDRLFNAVIIPIMDVKTNKWRYFPVICNVRHEHHLTQIALMGINVIN